VATLLESQREMVEGSPPKTDRYSAIEGEILTLLKRPAMYPQSFAELRHELSYVFSESQIWRAVRNLVDDGLIRIVYTCGFEIGFEWA
jgi:DNA-binding Lrp family transcriptional regulator